MAALIADEFNMDPITVLKSGWTDWAIRQACFEIVREQKRKEAEASKAAASKNK